MSVLVCPRSVSRSVQLTLKQLLDRAAAGVLLVVLGPLMLLIAAAIRVVDGAPVLFTQARLGRHGHVFRIWKFRTMVPGADELVDPDGSVTAYRITRTGRLLRKTSLDELPQLLNILRGEMSFVGPRPVLPDHWRRYDDEQRRRFCVRPGITGLAQVNGRNTAPWTQRLAWDVRYVDRFSLKLDLAIVLRTVIVVAAGEGISLDRNPEQVDDLPA